MKKDLQIAMGIKYAIPIGKCNWCKGLEAGREMCAYHQWLYNNMTRMNV